MNSQNNIEQKHAGKREFPYCKADRPLNASLELALVRYHLHLFTLIFIPNKFPNRLLEVGC